MDDNTPEIDASAREAQIRARVAALGEFYRNLMAYCISVPIMIAVNGLVLPKSGPWSLFVAGIWGLLLIVNALRLFVFKGWLTAEWEQRKVQELMQREKESG
jgi:uncharacterized protein YhhL (DUF1145 family)